MPRRRQNNGKISVFKGREARLNRAIFQILSHKGALTIYSIHKELKARRNLRYTRYATVNKRVRSLKDSNFIKGTEVKKTKAGFEATLYELTTRTYLAILLNSIDLDELVKQVDEVTALNILGIITHARFNYK